MLLGSPGENVMSSFRFLLDENIPIEVKKFLNSRTPEVPDPNVRVDNVLMTWFEDKIKVNFATP